MVERGPEKAGVGGSIPSLATTKFWMHLFQGVLRLLILSISDPANRNAPTP